MQKLIKVDSCDSITLEKAITFFNSIAPIKSNFNKNNHYYNISLEKASEELPKKKVFV